MAARNEVHPTRANFTAGILSPGLKRRVDSDIYLAGVEDAVNFIPEIEGGLRRRPGGGYVANTKDNGQVILIPFIFNRNQSYICEFGVGYIRFYQSSAQIATAAPTVITNISSTNPGVVDSVAHLLSNGDRGVIVGVNGMTEVNNVEFTAANVNANDLELSGVNTSGFVAYDSGGTVQKILEVANPYTTVAELQELQFDQANDVMYVTHPTHDVRKLVRTGAFSFTFTVPTFLGVTFNSADNRPAAVAFYDNRLYLAGTNNDPTTVWASVAGLFEDFQVGAASATDAFIHKIGSKRSNAIRWLSVTNNYLAIGTEGSELRGGSNSRDDAVTPTNFRTIPQTNIGSPKHRPIVLEDSCLYFQQSGRKLREFDWNAEKNKLGSEDLTKWSNQILFGSAVDMAYQAEPNSNIWVTTTNGTVSILTYRQEELVRGWTKLQYGGTDPIIESVAVIPGDNEDIVYASVKLTINSATQRHIVDFKEKFIARDKIGNEAAVTKEDAIFADSVLTFESTPFTIASMTKDNPVVLTTTGAHGLSNGDFMRPRLMEGVTNLNDRTFKVKNVAATTVELTDRDDNNIDGTGFTGTYVANSGNLRKEVFTIESLNHLIGESVTPWVNGRPHPALTVTSGGRITLDQFRGSIVHVGLGNSCSFKMLPLEPGNQRGTSSGKKLVLSGINLGVYQTMGGKIKINDGGNLTPIPGFKDNVLMDNSPDLLTGITKTITPFNKIVETEAQIIYENDIPAPVTILNVNPEYEVQSG